TIESTVTAAAGLLDASGRRLVVQDRTGAIEVLLPSGATAPSVGAGVRVAGATGVAWGAPQVAATELTRLGSGPTVAPVTLRRAPAERDEWQLVRISGTVAKVSRIGDRWKAELTLADRTAALVQGQAGAGIPSTILGAGDSVTITGIVRRPYPTASDRRFAVLPRGTSDVSVLGARIEAAVRGSGGNGDQIGAAAGATAGATAASDAITPDTDLATLGDEIGRAH